MPASFQSFELELNRLVGTFERNLTHYKSSGYDEASLRQEFLNPLFRALGWDVENLAGFIPTKREVEVESRTQISGRQKRADYLFRTDGRDRWVCEAKKPAETLDPRYAFQAKRYAWNKDLPLALLTDFEEIKIYIVGGKPHLDEPQVGELKSWHYKQFPLIAQELWDLLAREKVAAGSIEQLLATLPKSKPSGKDKARQQWLIKPDRSRALDTDFLEFLDEARKDLASDLYKHNDHDELLEDNKLNEAVQRILDRILFIRICEDRDIDTGSPLQSIVETWRKNYGREDTRRARQQGLELRDDSLAPSDGERAGVRGNSLWSAIIRHFRGLDHRPPGTVPFFNGNLFKPHFSERLIVSDAWLIEFIGDLSDEESPYLFSVIPVEILGSVYERFLGKVVRPQGKGITVEEKPEVRKAGGVYYTPRYIVNYIVEQTVGKLLDEIAGTSAASVAVLPHPGPLPLGEGTGPDAHGQSNASASSPTRDAALPLPAGEGRGEGERPTPAVTLKAFEKRTGALRLLDPACGSGSFLIRAFERVCEHYQKRLTDSYRQVLNPSGATLDLTEPEARKLGQTWEKKHRPLCWVDEVTGDIHLTVDLKRRVLTQNIYGVDLDSAAVEVTQLSLYLKMLEHENRTTLERERELFAESVALLPPLQDNIKCGNSLIASDFSMMPEDLVRVHAFDWPVQFRDIMKAGGFDAVVGNPPYRMLQPHNTEPEELNYLKEHYVAAEFKIELFHLFLQRGITLLRTGGYHGYIVPTTLLNNVYAESLRRWLMERCAIQTISIAQGRVFEDADVHTSVVVFRAESSAKARAEYEVLTTSQLSANFAAAPTGFTRTKQKRFENLPGATWNILLNETNATLIERLISKQAALETVGTINRGLVTGDRAKYFSARKTLASHVPILTGTDVNRYAMQTPAEFVRFERPDKAGGCWDREVHLAPHKIVIRQIGTEPTATLITEPFAVTANIFTVRAASLVEEKYLLAVINSKLTAYFWKTMFADFKASFPQVTIFSLSQVPVRKIDFAKPTDKARHDKLVTLVDKVLGLMPKLRAATSEAEKATLQNAVTATDHQIDALVYDLYALTPEEIQLVEGGQ